jgi:chromosome segregation ATPase
MSKEMGGASSESFGAKVEGAERRLQEAVAAAEVAETRATAEIRALEANLEKERLNTAQAVEELRAKHDEELRREREAKEQAIAAAEGRLGEIEAQAEVAEKRVEAAERRATEAEQAIADSESRAREAAATWLRGKVESVRREARR